MSQATLPDTRELELLWSDWLNDGPQTVGIIPTIAELEEKSVVSAKGGTLTGVTADTPCTFTCYCGTTNCTSHGSCVGGTWRSSMCGC